MGKCGRGLFLFGENEKEDMDSFFHDVISMKYSNHKLYVNMLFKVLKN